MRSVQSVSKLSLSVLTLMGVMMCSPLAMAGGDDEESASGAGRPRIVGHRSDEIKIEGEMREWVNRQFSPVGKKASDLFKGSSVPEELQATVLAFRKIIATVFSTAGLTKCELLWIFGISRADASDFPEIESLCSTELKVSVAAKEISTGITVGGVGTYFENCVSELDELLKTVVLRVNTENFYSASGCLEDCVLILNQISTKALTGRDCGTDLFMVKIERPGLPGKALSALEKECRKAIMNGDFKKLALVFFQFMTQLPEILVRNARDSSTTSAAHN